MAEHNQGGSGCAIDGAVDSIERYLDGGLPPVEEERLRRHFGECVACRSTYDAAWSLLRTAAGDGELPTSEQWASMEARLRLARARPQLAIEPLRAPPTERRRWPLRRQLLLAAGMATAAAAAALWLLPRWSAAPLSVPPLAGRGDAAVLEKGGHGPPMVRIDAHAIPAADPAAARLLHDGDVVFLDEYLQLAYVSPEPRLRYLVVAAIDSRQQLLVYFPRPEEDRSIAITPTTAPRTVGPSIRLAKRHVAGRLSVCSLFSEGPLRRDALSAALLAEDGPAQTPAAGSTKRCIALRLEARQ